ncbi:MAG: protein kinase [Armatimonadetes bacterium]|nr:serine/threonine protein kinase [Armatimonadota bacterium]NOG92621.1 protein kinase [Armatimonadota bacterium]
MESGSGTLGKYQIIREIARSNDIVYEAWDPAMNRRVALKELMMPTGASDKQKQERIARFQREAKAAGSLAHPNIVTIYEVGIDGDRFFLAMEYLEGQTLRNRLDAEGFLKQDEAIEIMLQVLDGLAYAHEKGVIHRDIKPDNIQLLPDGRVKITDFGIARLTFEPTLTVDGQIFGTPSYMSPEQVVGRDIDHRSDLFSCGVVLYEALTGRKPFGGDSVVSISHEIMHLDPPDPPQASFSVAQLLRRALEKSPELRFASAKVMASAFREALAALRADPTVAAPPTIPGAAATGQMPTLFNPYSAGPSPYQPTPNAPPVITTPTAAANPYGQQYGQPYGQPYGQTTTGMPNVPIPYPPDWIAPPRKPLFKPETAEFLRKTTWVVIIGGAIVALGFAIVSGLTVAADRQQKERADEATVARSYESAVELIEQDPNAAIAELTSLVSTAQSDSWRAKLSRALSDAYIERAERSTNLDSARTDYLNAVSADTSNPTAYAKLGTAEAEIAAESSDLNEKAQWLDQAREHLAVAVQLSGGPQQATDLARQTSSVCNQLARILMTQSRWMDAELVIRQSLEFAPEGSEQAKTAADLLTKLGY